MSAREKILHSMARSDFVRNTYGILRQIPVVGPGLQKLVHAAMPVGSRLWIRIPEGLGKGLWMYVDPRFELGYANGDHEPWIQEKLKSELRPGDCYCDVGAHTGFFSLIASRFVGPSGGLVALEPDPENAALLRTHMEKNGVEHAAVLQAAAWSSPGQVTFERASDASNRTEGRIASTGDSRQARITVSAVRLDDIFFGEGHPPPHLIKMDVEGAEWEALQGARRLLSEAKPKLLCEVHNRGQMSQIRAYLEEFGYMAEEWTPVHPRYADYHQAYLWAVPAGGPAERMTRSCTLSGPSSQIGRSPRNWIALLGRKDEPTDGVEDYCAFLGQALVDSGVELRPVRVPWLNQGWLVALQGLWRDAAGWRGQWVLLQYTALSWSRRGFPLGALAVLAVLRGRGIRCAAVFHEPWSQGQTPGWPGRMRGTCQDWVIHRLYWGAAKAIFTIPVETIPWLPKEDAKSAFIPIGANIPERVSRRSGSTPEGRRKNVIVFGVTGPPEMAGEVEEISAVLREACASLGGLRLAVIGRGAIEARDDLVRSLASCDVELTVRGILPAEEIAREFECADALLFVRGAITPRRGSAMAGIACGVPIIGYQNGEISGPLGKAGIEWSPWRDRDSLARGLVRVLSDPARWMDLHVRNLEVQKNHFSWGRIAKRYRMAMTE